jgi:DNA modification methylase
MIHNVNCLDFIPTLPDESLDAVVSDPPYGEGMGYDGDNSLTEAEDLIHAYLRALEPKLKRNAHVVLFWTMRTLDVLIDAVRSCGFTYRRTLSMYIPRGNARPYLGWLPRTQSIVVAQKYLPKQPTEFHADMAKYLLDALEHSEHTRASLARALNCDSRLIMKWTRVGDPAWCIPTPRFYKPLKVLLNLDDTYDILLTREPTFHGSGREDLIYQHDCYIVDEKLEKMIHPSQKPLSVVSHIINCVTKPGDTVFDGFCGSGTTAVAAQNSGRNFICCEISPEFYAISNERLASCGIEPHKL